MRLFFFLCWELERELFSYSAGALLFVSPRDHIERSIFASNVSHILQFPRPRCQVSTDAEERENEREETQDAELGSNRDPRPGTSGVIYYAYPVYLDKT